MVFEFKDEEKLFVTYLPDKLVHRESELKKLEAIFAPAIENNAPVRAFITGNPGTGKTALARLFALRIKELSRDIETVYLNCKDMPTDMLAVLEIIRTFNKEYLAKGRGYAAQKVFHDLSNILKERGIHLVVILDEANILLSRSSELVYLLARALELGRGNISLILVSLSDVRPLMDASMLSTLRLANTLRLSNYEESQLKDIIKQRIELALYPRTVWSDSTDLIAKIAARYGCARTAIELLLYAGRYAQQQELEKITPECVRAAKAEVYPYYTDSKLNALTKRQKLLLMAVARILKKELAFTTTGEVEECCKIIFEEYEEEPVSHTTLWRELQVLDKEGLIDTETVQTKEGATTQIYIEDIPAKILEEFLIEKLS